MAAAAAACARCDVEPLFAVMEKRLRLRSCECFLRCLLSGAASGEVEPLHCGERVNSSQALRLAACLDEKQLAVFALNNRQPDPVQPLPLARRLLWQCRLC